ncbi:hypothetical protein F5Y04DRAFT_219629 [Hypomontagnella monticulosa]|nr:hypothetical protein F5Y04DRAFT_219629 [Hypomontagnella monticulosa]
MREHLLSPEWWRCIGILVLGVLIQSTIAVNDDGYKIHTLEKNYNLLRHPKRDPSCQQSGYSLCPASANGGCCPDGYGCAESYCTATTAGPTSACGKLNWYACPISAGPGSCCPVGFICGTDCYPASGDAASFACPTSHFGCPSSLGGGCCPDGLACGSATCYDTHPQTTTVTGLATTTNSQGDKITTATTETTVITPGPGTSTAVAGLVGVPKLIPSTVSKMPAIETGNSNDGGGGLSQAAIGGIVGGAIGLLAIIIIIAAVIIWRLKRTERYAREAAESRRNASSSEPRSQKSGFGQPCVSEVDGTDVDSVMRARATHNRNRSDSTTAGSRTPDLWGSNASTTPPTWVGWSTRPPPSNASDGQRPSMESYGGGRYDNNIPYPPRPSVESQAPQKPMHTRQHSDVPSELDGSTVGAHGISELDNPEASEAARRRSNSATRPPLRRTSDPSGKSRGDNGQVTATALGPLPEVSELHGHYGPADLACGQTAAKLNHKNSSLSSLPKNEKE